MTRSVVTIAVYAAVAVAWTWPLVLDPLGLVVSGFDTWGTVWLAHAVETMGWDGATRAGGWPLGQNLGRSDSMLLVYALRLLPGELHPVGVVSALVLLGPILSAWAAERCAAHALGVGWPWSLLAGFAFGFLGVARAMLADGEVYALFVPWLPALAWAWWRATSPTGRAVHGVLAGLAWAACLLTTAYVGVAATMLVLLGFARRPPWGPPLLGAAAVAVPAAAAWLVAFAGGDLRAETGGAFVPEPTALLALGSLPLSGLAGTVASAPGGTYRLQAPIGWTVIALVAVAPLVLRDRAPGWRWWAALGLVGAAASLGPTVRVDAVDRHGFPWLLGPFAAETVTHWFRFPSRLGWLTGIGLGVVAARTLAELARRRPRLAAPLLAAAALECVLLTGRARHVEVIPARLPSAYLATPPDRPLLDVYPGAAGMPVDWELYNLDVTCAWAGLHRRPVAQRCLETEPDVDPRARIVAVLHDRLLTGADPGETARMLAELGFGSVVARPHDYAPNERTAVVDGLTAALGQPVAASDDAGVHLVAWEVGTADVDPVEAYRRWVP